MLKKKLTTIPKVVIGKIKLSLFFQQSMAEFSKSVRLPTKSKSLSGEESLSIDTMIMLEELKKG